MKDYEVSYVHEESKTVPVIGQQLIGVIENISIIAPTTVKDVLLARWAKDTRELAKLFVDSRYDAIIRAYTTQDGSLCWEYDDALEAEIAYLNSAAEGATK